MGQNITYRFFTFFGDVGSHDYEKDISVRKFYLKGGNSLRRSEMGRTGQAKVLVQIRQSVRLYIRSSVSRRKTISC